MPRALACVVSCRVSRRTCGWQSPCSRTTRSGDEAETQRERRVYLYNIIILCVVNKYVRWWGRGFGGWGEGMRIFSGWSRLWRVLTNRAGEAHTHTQIHLTSLTFILNKFAKCLMSWINCTWKVKEEEREVMAHGWFRACCRAHRILTPLLYMCYTRLLRVPYPYAPQRCIQFVRN